MYLSKVNVWCEFIVEVIKIENMKTFIHTNIHTCVEIKIYSKNYPHFMMLRRPLIFISYTVYFGNNLLVIQYQSQPHKEHERICKYILKFPKENPLKQCYLDMHGRASCLLLLPGNS